MILFTLSNRVDYLRMLTIHLFFTDSTAEKVEEVNADLANVDEWYEQNRMKRNTSKYQVIVMESHSTAKILL